MRLAERAAIFDRIDNLVAPGVGPDELATGAGRVEPATGSASGLGWPITAAAWGALTRAERAVDAARINKLTRARELADGVLNAAQGFPDGRDGIPTGTDGGRHENGVGTPRIMVNLVARARATEALGRVLAWTGTDRASAQADRVLADVCRQYRDLARICGAAGDAELAALAHEWACYATFWRGHAVHFQTGAMARAVELIERALADLAADSPRRAAMLSFYADVLIVAGRWPDADRALTEGELLADAAGDERARSYLTWSRARLASVRLDSMTTERSIREVERDNAEWFETDTGATFLADAAEMLDRVGVADQAARYLRRAIERSPDDEFVRQAVAVLAARGGDPVAAMDAVQELARGQWLEKRDRWRLTLFAAWATFRAGRDGAGELAARALEQAREAGGLTTALSIEPELTRAVLPLAAIAGSSPAQSALVGDTAYTVRLFGRPRVSDAAGRAVGLPPGMPAELVRMLAVEPGGRSVEQVAETFFPDAPVSTGRHRLRQVLARLRTADDGLVVRDGDRLALAPAWVDVREFLAITDRVRALRGQRAVQLAYAGLALWAGPPLPDDAYADWSAGVRRLLEHRHLGLLDLVIADADRRGSHQEAATAIAAALELAPDDRRYSRALADHLLALGRHAAARDAARMAGDESGA